MLETYAVVIAFIVFALLLVAGQNINTVLLVTGIVGVLIIGGITRLQGFLINVPFDTVATYTYTTIPLYVIMAQFVMRSGMIDDFYNLAFKLSKQKPVALGTITIILGGILGALSGSSIATSAALGQIAVPELRKRGYPASLAGTVAAGAGSLSSVIPPSLVLIVYGGVTETSIGKLFMASFIPGVLLMLVFIVIAALQFKYIKPTEDDLNYDVETTIQEVPTRQLAISIISGTVIMLTVFVGIYTGLFTPTEAGAVGAFVGFLSCLVTRRLTLAAYKEMAFQSIKVTSMTLIIVVAAMVFSRFLTLSLVPRKLIAALGPLMDSPALILTILLVIYFILFMLIDGTAVILMTVPMLYPVLLELNVDIIWFGVFICMLLTIGTLSPPVGLNVYTVVGVTGLKLEEVFKVALSWAVIGTVVVGGLLIAFPELATWLPSTMQ